MATLNLENGVYFIQNFGTGTAVELKDGSSADSTRVVSAPKRELDNVSVPASLWIISRVSGAPGHQYTLQNAKSGTFMDVLGGASNVKDNVDIVGFQKLADSKSQRWTITRHNDTKAYVIANAVTGKHYVNLPGGDRAAGRVLQVVTGEGIQSTNVDQMWLIVRA
ncbi:ricin B lectin domain-containing protein [Dichomitus squalens]|uniref:Ricin B lectin domain-containing protein n=1 Tax=Dichomitus squalens TaxID=114155 RepID=A0A4Q9PKQ7_9APHY|nr:ricin B lectin domain-containing protein [Dichomitus squalens]